MFLLLFYCHLFSQNLLPAGSLVPIASTGILSLEGANGHVFLPIVAAVDVVLTTVAAMFVAGKVTRTAVIVMLQSELDIS